MYAKAEGTQRPGSGTQLIRASGPVSAVDLREFWAYRELLFFITWRDIKVRYAQTVIGAGWAILQPVLTMVVFTLVFGRLAGLPSEGVPYALFTFAGLLPWLYFAAGLGNSSNSLVSSASLLSKVYFPRLVIPASAILPPLVDMAFGSLVLAGLMAYYHVVPTWTILFLPAFLAVAVVTALGFGLWLSALNVQYRDIRYVVPLLTQLWLFATPVAYSASLIPASWRLVYSLNPMVGVVEGFRWSILGVGAPPGLLFVASVMVSLLVLISGAFYFRSTERKFVDVV